MLYIYIYIYDLFSRYSFLSQHLSPAGLGFALPKLAHCCALAKDSSLLTSSLVSQQGVGDSLALSEDSRGDTLGSLVQFPTDRLGARLKQATPFTDADGLCQGP